MPYCLICNRNVEVSNVNKFPEYEVSVFDCGHTAKHIARGLLENVAVTDSAEITPKKGERIPVTISGDSGAKISGDLVKFNPQVIDNRVHFNFNITNINAPLTDVSLNQNISQTSTIDNILTNLDHSSLSGDIKNQVRNSIEDFRRESEQNKPDEGKLKSILNKVFPIAKDIGMMLFKHALDQRLFSGSPLFH
jgi:hypothetical protein